MLKRIAAICFIYICVAIAWIALGEVVNSRTYEQDPKLRGDVGSLWGTEQQQQAPWIEYQIIRQIGNNKPAPEATIHQATLDTSDLNVDLNLDYRRKGLLWYSTYRVDLASTYRVTNTSSEPWLITFHYAFPADGAIYDNFRFVVGGETVADVTINSNALSHHVELAPGQSETFEVGYASQGMDKWWYDFGTDVTQVKNFAMTMNTNFDLIDFPPNTMSPTEKEQTAQGWKLDWHYTNLLSSQRPIGMVMPEKLQPGPWASKIIYFAPVPLFLFFFLLFLFTTVRKVKIHPMNYFFIGAAFFSYHLLLAYMVDHVSIHLAFWIASLVSIFLVVSYMRLVVGTRLALVEIGIAQFVYLVLFSYTFFFEGYTGLVVTIMCIITLFVVMQFTGKVDWDTVFRKGESRPAPVAPVAPVASPQSPVAGGGGMTG